MWLSQRRGGPEKNEGAAQVGKVTLAGDPAGVCMGGERRQLPVFAPGGYQWRPEIGDQVLVLKAGDNGELACVAGSRREPVESLPPGEIRIQTGDGKASISLGRGGVVRLEGKFFVNGERVGPLPEEEEGE